MEYLHISRENITCRREAPSNKTIQKEKHVLVDSVASGSLCYSVIDVWNQNWNMCVSGVALYTCVWVQYGGTLVH